jgi:hypothetical protein
MEKVRAIGARQFDLATLTPDQFQELTFLLAHAVEGDVVPVRAKDQGLDARLPGALGRRTLRGWQAKRYTGEINWAECEYSVKRAIAFWRPTRITFCFPKSLSANEQKNFETRLVERFTGVRLDWWDEAELQRLMRDTEEGQRAGEYLFANPLADRETALRIGATGGELSTTSQAVDRLGVINRYLQTDPHFRYAIGLREPGTPQSGPPRGTFLSVDLAGDDAVVRIDAAERHPDALAAYGPAGAFVFDDDDAGQRALAEVDRLTREGGRAVISSGMGIRMERVPQHLAEFIPEGVHTGTFELIAGEQALSPPAELHQTVLVAAGDAEAAVELVTVDAPDDWGGALGGGLGGLEVFVLVRRQSEDGPVESRLDWRYRAGEGSTVEQVLACDLMRAGLSGEPVELRDPESGRALMRGVMEEPSGDDDADRLAGRREALALLAELEAWTGATFEPPAEWTAEDVATVIAAVARIRQPEQDGTWERQQVKVRPEAVPDDLDTAYQFAFLVPLSIRLFGRVVPLGTELVHLPEGKIELTDDSGVAADIVPVTRPGTATVRLFPPDDHPAAASATPPSGVESADES